MRNARDDRVRGTAAQALLDRGFGKPKVEIQNTNADFRDALEQAFKKKELRHLCFETLSKLKSLNRPSHIVS